MKTVDILFEETGFTVEEVAERAQLPVERVEAIAVGRWTPSPTEPPTDRRRLQRVRRRDQLGAHHGPAQRALPAVRVSRVMSLASATTSKHSNDAADHRQQDPRRLRNSERLDGSPSTRNGSPPDEKSRVQSGLSNPSMGGGIGDEVSTISDEDISCNAISSGVYSADWISRSNGHDRVFAGLQGDVTVDRRGILAHRIISNDHLKVGDRTNEVADRDCFIKRVETRDGHVWLDLRLQWLRHGVNASGERDCLGTRRVSQ